MDSEAVTAFRLPESGESYVRLILERCNELIDSRVWGGLDRPRLNLWLRNFRTDEERYFAAVVLDALIYRSADQTRSLMLDLFHRALPDLVASESLPGVPGDDWLSALQDGRSDPGIRVAPVIRPADPPTKSGPLVCRLLKRHLQISERWMIWPWDIGRQARAMTTLLLVDDFLGTGYQFRKFARRIHLDRYAGSSTFIYAPLVAHVKGLKRIQKRVPYVHLTAVERLTDEHSPFSPASSFFQDGVNSPSTALQFYRQLLQSRKLGSKGLGYGRFGLVYAFEHAAPNASLPIIWLRSEGWEPLFDR